jgi:hypothetical protein
MLKQFKYQNDASLGENMKKLCICLENIMDVQNLDDFQKFICNEENLPIEFNLK